jgi:hypothetical protein
MGNPGSNARGICGSRSRKISIERRRRDTKALRDLSDGDVGIGEYRLGSLDIILGEFRRTASGAAKAPGSGQTCLDTLADQGSRMRNQRLSVMQGPAVASPHRH